MEKVNQLDRVENLENKSSNVRTGKPITIIVETIL